MRARQRPSPAHRPRPRLPKPSERVARVYTIRWVGARTMLASRGALLVTTIDAPTRIVNCFFFKKKKHAAFVLSAVSELLIRRSIPIGLTKIIFFKFSTLIFYEVYFIKETQKWNFNWKNNMKILKIRSKKYNQLWNSSFSLPRRNGSEFKKPILWTNFKKV